MGLHVEILEARQLLTAASSISGSVGNYSVSIDRHDAPGVAIDHQEDAWIIIHGNSSGPTTGYIDQLASAVHTATGGDQVLTVDWSDIAALYIGTTENNIIPVARWASSALTNYGFEGSQLNLIGHSFGAYVAAEMGELINSGVGVNSIVGLDPAENWPFPFNGYNPANQVNFAAHSQFSWTFSDAGGFSGHVTTPNTADEAITVTNTSHSEVVTLFSNLITGSGNSDVVNKFSLTRLENASPGPWVPNQYANNGNQSGSGGYEAVIAADGSGVIANSIQFVPNGPVNQRPTADSQTVTATEDQMRTITLTGDDADGDLLSYSVVTGPAHGSISGNAPNLTYHPNANFNGPDSFTFVTNDGTENSPLATVTINVQPVNDAPIADPQTVQAKEDTPKQITLSASDIDSAGLTFVVQDGPSNGVLSGNAPDLRYTPNPGFFGPDSFTFIASDWQANSNVATVTIAVAANRPPVADPKTVNVNEDNPIAITLTGSDPDADPIGFQVTLLPTHGILSGTAPNLIYTPTKDYNGPDSFKFIVNDGTDNSDPATVSITVNPINDPPVADDENATTPEDTPVKIDVLDGDTDVDSASFFIDSVTQGTHGTVVNNGNDLTYIPNPHYFGPDTFTYTVKDPKGGQDVATVNVSVTSVNDPPIADPQNVQAKEDTPKLITLSASDVDNVGLNFVVLNGPSSGVLSGTAPNLTYTPSPGFTGPDSFTFFAFDGLANSNVATVSISVVANQPPVANPQAVNVNEDNPIAITLTGSDPDGDPITFQVTSLPAHGTLTGTVPNLVYTPAKDYNGPDSLKFIVNDGTDNSDPATVSITVNPINDPPVADDENASTAEDTPVTIDVLDGDTDVDSASFFVDSITQGTHGTVVNNGTDLTYIPNLNYFGPDSFTYTVSDPEGGRDVATVNVNVTPVNDKPVAVDDPASTTEEKSTVIDILANDTDAENHPLTLVSVEDAVNGTVVVNPDQTITYTPKPGFIGSESFNYIISDGNGGTDEGTVTVEVTEEISNQLYVYDIRFESQFFGFRRRAVFEIRSDSNENGVGDSGDAVAAGVAVTVEFAGVTYTGVTDANGIFRTPWVWTPPSGSYAEVLDMSLADHEWLPLLLDREDDSDGDGRPDAVI